MLSLPSQGTQTLLKLRARRDEPLWPTIQNGPRSIRRTVQHSPLNPQGLSQNVSPTPCGCLTLAVVKSQHHPDRDLLSAGEIQAEATEKPQELVDMTIQDGRRDCNGRFPEPDDWKIRHDQGEFIDFKCSLVTWDFTPCHRP